tara:strand:+ start:6250 stop:7155 length:906 start_codon:yes stop_codon:yes gene_type:complete
MKSRYVGRFAPSPTGELHFGSLVAAVASYADAKSHNGSWLLRIDDIDQPRSVGGSSESIIAALKAFGFQWDGPIRWQSEREHHYQAAIAYLHNQSLTYPCRCSRRQIEKTARDGVAGLVYPGTCREWNGASAEQVAIRMLTKNVQVTATDRIVGDITQNLEADIGDFIIFRADGITAYQLAVVVDDFLDNVTHVVRGADLVLSTPRQVYLQDKLNYPVLQYAHVPLVRDTEGAKISKRDDAHPIDPVEPLSALQAAWQFLKQAPMPEPIEDLERFWAHAAETWRIEALRDTDTPVSAEKIA